MDGEPKALNQFESLNQVIDHLESIPDSDWCKYHTVDKKGRHCALGHFNMYTIGMPNGWVNAHKILTSFGADVDRMVFANNSDDNPKRGTLIYLKSILIQNGTV